MTYHGSCSHRRGRRFRPVIRCGPCGFVPIIGSIAVGIVQTLPASRQSRVRPNLGGHLKESSKVNDKGALCTGWWLSVWILEAYCVCLAKNAGCKQQLLTSGLLTHDSTLKKKCTGFKDQALQRLATYVCTTFCITPTAGSLPPNIFASIIHKIAGRALRLP